jgi:HSP20 family molecular chaperone IbpA
MTTLMRHRPTPISDLFGWLDAEKMFGTSGIGLTPYIRLEDFVDEGTYVLRAEMPGIDPDKDVQLTIEGDVLTIHGERQQETRDRNHHEFHYGSFDRSLTLPRQAKVDEIKAEYKHGILELKVPLVDDGQKPRRVPIEHVEA